MSWVLPVSATGYVGGLVLGALWGGHPALGWVGLAAALLSLLLLNRRPFRAAVLLGVSMVLFGAARARTYQRSSDPPCDAARLNRSRALRLWLRVEDEPIWGADIQRQRASVWAAGADGEPATAFCGEVEVTRPRSDAPLWPGQSLVARGRWRPATLRSSPAARSPEGGLALARPTEPSGYFFTTEAELVRLGRAAPRWHQGLRHHLRTVLQAAADDEPARALLAALVVGDGGRVSASQRERFGRAGMAHLLAVSGLHLVLVAMTLVFVFDALLRRVSMLASRALVRRWAALIGIAAAIVYTALTGAGIATERACVMTVAVLAGTVLGRPRDLVRPLALAALVLLVTDPGAIWRAAFQLSFVAVIGLALAARHPLAAALRRRSWLERAVGSLLLASASASLATAPVTAYHFQTVSLIAPLANLFGVPFVSFLVLPVALLGALIAGVARPVGAPLLHLAVGAVHWLDWFAGWAAAPSWAALRLSLSPLSLVALAAVALALLLTSRPARRGLALVAGVALIAGPVAQRLARERRAVVATLDAAGSGPTMIALPDGATLLFGAGRSAAAGEAGRQPLVRWLRRSGVERVDYLVLPAESADDLGGLIAVLGAIEVGELWLVGEASAPALARVLRWIAPQRLRLRPPRALTGRDWRLEALRCELWTGGGKGRRRRSMPRRRGLALALRFGQSEVLLTAGHRVARCWSVAGGRARAAAPGPAGFAPGGVVLPTLSGGTQRPRALGASAWRGQHDAGRVDPLALPERGARVVELLADGTLRSRAIAASSQRTFRFED
ncbi:MAG: ComEC/Rec2 family competence protein [Proteobacteria bacterium]|nr:ComEC/Rec2 family competence protein [Pseudomonadota bacterium]